MKTCKDCIHYGVCRYNSNVLNLEICEGFKDKSKIIELPFSVGDKVYQISEGFIEQCTVEVIYISNYKDKNGFKSYMAEIYYDRDDCPYVSTEIYLTDIGRTVFLTKEEAEKALDVSELADQ